MHFETSPNPSPSQPIAIGRSASPSDSLYSFQRQSSSSPSRSSVCSYPSWPTGSSLGSYRTSAPSSFISDEDLFPEDLLDSDSGSVFLEEAPAPPRDERHLQQPQACPLLPLFAPSKPKSKRRPSNRSSKSRRSSKPMTPISESPETPE